MSPVSPEFNNEVTVSIGLKNVLRMGTSICCYPSTVLLIGWMVSEGKFTLVNCINNVFASKIVILEQNRPDLDSVLGWSQICNTKITTQACTICRGVWNFPHKLYLYLKTFIQTTLVDFCSEVGEQILKFNFLNPLHFS